MKKENDWRLTNQINYLFDKQLKFSKYVKHSDIWEHDHCEFCYEKFFNESQHGYSTLDNYYWICENCFNDFHEMFEWTLT